MKHEVPALPYAADALEPIMSRETIEYHHGKHVTAYVNKLNELIPGTPFENATLEEIIMKADGAIFNNGAQVWNHTFYFDAFRPQQDAKKAPEGELATAINQTFGSFEQFKEAFKNAGIGQFGSGYAWLVKDQAGTVKIVATPNAANPMRDGMTPLLTCDVWEHAYYIDYRNRRPDFLDGFWKIVDWNIVEERYAK